MIRLFAALVIPPDAAAALTLRQQGLAGARWSPQENLHVTLRFFGELREDVARDLDAELLTIRVKPFDLVLEGAGLFQDDHGPNAVWAGVAENAELRGLAKACEAAARRVGLKPELRAYHPHVTLAYLRRGADPEAVAGWVQANNLLKSPPLRISRFALYSSHLGKTAPVYEIEAEYPG